MTRTRVHAGVQVCCRKIPRDFEFGIIWKQNYHATVETMVGATEKALPAGFPEQFARDDDLTNLVAAGGDFADLHVAK